MLLPAGVDIHRFVPHRPNTNSNKSSNSSSHESVPTGRQQAVDAILDASSEGSYYRAMNIQVCFSTSSYLSLRSSVNICRECLSLTFSRALNIICFCFFFRRWMPYPPY